MRLIDSKDDPPPHITGSNNDDQPPYTHINNHKMAKPTSTHSHTIAMTHSHILTQTASTMT